jgi:hypothetical protein
MPGCPVWGDTSFLIKTLSACKGQTGRQEKKMKKALVLFGVLALVVNMGISADPLSDGKKYVKMAKDIWGGDLNQLHKAYDQIAKAADELGKISAGLESYKFLKSLLEVTRWSRTYMNATTDAEYIAANKGASSSMIKMLDSFINLAGGPLYGIIGPTLLKGVENAVKAIHLRKAEQLYAEWCAHPWMYYNGETYHGWDWNDLHVRGYSGIAVEIIDKYAGDGPYKPLPIAVRICEILEKLK